MQDTCRVEPTDLAWDIMLRGLLGLLLLAAIVGGGDPRFRSQSPAPPQAASSLVREEQTMRVGGITEVWRLEWKSPPRPACAPEDADSSLTCPCSGFAFGESGQLDLVRTANDKEIERLELTPLFEEVFADQDGAIVQRWEVLDKDLEESRTETFAARVRSRPVVRIMHFADYNHDGAATEFFLQTGVEPCGKLTGIVIGLTQRNPRLHAFGTVLHPDKPLVLQKREWQALLEAKGRVEVRDWACGDHASEIEVDLELSAANKGIRVIRREYACLENDHRGQLIRKEIR